MENQTNKKKVLGPAFLEAALVVLGVVLAFAANEWRETKSQVEKAESAFSSIREELQVNRDLVQTSLSYHKHLYDTLIVMIGENAARIQKGQKEQLPDVMVFQKGFVSPAHVMSTAWEAAKATDVLNHVEYSDLLLISRMYTEQDRYMQQTKLVGQVIYELLLIEGTHGVLAKYKNLLAVVSTFHYRETQLLKSYEETLQSLGNREAE